VDHGNWQTLEKDIPHLESLSIPAKQYQSFSGTNKKIHIPITLRQQGNTYAIPLLSQKIINGENPYLVII